MREPAQALAEAIAFQLDCWQQVASAPIMNPRERNDARKKFLALIAEYPDIAAEYGYSAKSLAALSEPTGETSADRVRRKKP
jgi:hypothetical protein